MQPRTADEFLDLACLTHTENDAVERREQAEAILAASPGLAQEDAYVAAAVGDVGALREHLDCDADLVTRRGGPRDWDALLYVCNARLAARKSWDPLACARLLLDRGADPRTHARALVELLLDAGADPNDEQALYNMHFLRDDGWLELLLARGLREPARLDYLLGASVKQGFGDRVALLLAHGASSNGRDFY